MNNITKLQTVLSTKLGALAIALLAFFGIATVANTAASAASAGVQHGLVGFDQCKALADWAPITYDKEFIDGHYTVTGATLSLTHPVAACENAQVTLEILSYSDPVTQEGTRSAQTTLQNGTAFLDFSGTNAVPAADIYDIALTVVS